MVAMPNLVDLPIRQAIALIESSGLEMGQLKYKPDLSIDVVIEQPITEKITEGDSLQKGSVIDLILGKGLSNQRTSVPDLIGMNLEPAKNKILISSLNLGTYIYDNTIINGKDTLNAFVYKQNPEYRKMPPFSLVPQYISGLQLIQQNCTVDSTLRYQFRYYSMLSMSNEPSN